MFYVDISPPPINVFPSTTEEYIVVQPAYPSVVVPPAYPTVEQKRFIILPDGSTIEINSTTMRRYYYNGCCVP